MPSATAPMPSRRSLALGLAWTVPAITVAASAPAFAASGPPPVAPTSSSAACKLSASGGGKIYQFTFVFKNTLGAPSYVCLASGTMSPTGCDAVGIDTSTYSPAGGCTTVAAGATTTIIADSLPAACFATGTATITYTYTDAGQTVTTTQPLTFAKIDPCK